MDHGQEPELAHPLAVPADPAAIEGDALEPGVEADAGEAELVAGSREFREARLAVPRLDDAHRDGKPVGAAVPIGSDGVVLGARVRDAVRAFVAVAGDHDGLRRPRPGP